MVGPGLGSHGEEAIAKAQQGMAHNDTHFRVGVLLWAILALAAGGYSFTRVSGDQSGLGHGIEFAALQLGALGVSVGVAIWLGKRNRRKREAEYKERRDIKAAERARQMAEFKAAQK